MTEGPFVFLSSEWQTRSPLAKLMDKLIYDAIFGATSEDLDEDKIFATHIPATALVAKTIWILWKGNYEKIWDILIDWSSGHAILAATCREIIKIGLSSGYLTNEQVFKRIEDWLLDANQDSTRAATQLLPEIPKEYLFDAISKWAASPDKKCLRALRRIMLHLFHVDPNKSLKVFIQWSRSNESKLYDVMADTFDRIVLPAIKTDEFYQSLSKQMIALKSIIGRRHERASQAIQKVLKSAKNQRSRLINKADWQRKTRGTKG